MISKGTHPDDVRSSRAADLFVWVQPPLRGLVDEAALLGEVIFQPHSLHPGPPVHPGSEAPRAPWTPLGSPCAGLSQTGPLPPGGL